MVRECSNPAESMLIIARDLQKNLFSRILRKLVDHRRTFKTQGHMASTHELLL